MPNQEKTFFSGEKKLSFIGSNNQNCGLQKNEIIVVKPNNLIRSHLKLSIHNECLVFLKESNVKVDLKLV